MCVQGIAELENKLVCKLSYQPRASDHQLSNQPGRPSYQEGEGVENKERKREGGGEIIQ